MYCTIDRMKTKSLVLSFILVLLLNLVAAAPALAAKPFVAKGGVAKKIVHKTTGFTIPVSAKFRPDRKGLLFNFTNFHEITGQASNDVFTCDIVITAIGQSPNTELFSELDEQTDKKSSLININNENGFTNFKNVFAAGDICNGNHQSVIGAIASGRRAATGIRQLLENYKYGYEGIAALKKLNQSSGKYGVPKKDFSTDEDLLEGIKGMDLFQACAKCNHCIDNFGCPAMIKVNGKIEIDYQKCTNCGLCIDVCPNNAITFIGEIVYFLEYFLSIVFSHISFLLYSFQLNIAFKV